MSFSISGPEPTSAIQRTHQSNEGGAGNLGYFQQGKKKKKDENEDENDKLELSTKKNNEDDDDANEKMPDSIGSKIKTFWFKINGVFNEVVEDSNQDELSKD